LATMLTGAGADVFRRVLPVGHQLSQADISLAREWLARADVAVDTTLA
jgi:phospholipase/carboxylesterase